MLYLTRFRRAGGRARRFEPDHVRRVLPLMLTCGMYDYSGQWAYDIGVPAKSGVGGCVSLARST